MRELIKKKRVLFGLVLVIGFAIYYNHSSYSYQKPFFRILKLKSNDFLHQIYKKYFMKKSPAHMKDIVYLQGYLRVKAHLTQYPDDYKLLFTGKVGLQHLSLVKSLVEQGLVSLPTLLPQHLTELCKDIV